MLRRKPSVPDPNQSPALITATRATIGPAHAPAEQAHTPADQARTRVVGLLWQLATQSKLYPILKEHCGAAAARVLFDLACLCLLDPERFAALVRTLGQDTKFDGAFCSYLTGQSYDVTELRAVLGTLSGASQQAVYRALTKQGRSELKRMKQQHGYPRGKVFASGVDPMMPDYEQAARLNSPAVGPGLPVSSFYGIKLPLQVENKGSLKPLYLMSLALDPCGCPCYQYLTGTYPVNLALAAQRRSNLSTALREDHIIDCDWPELQQVCEILERTEVSREQLVEALRWQALPQQKDAPQQQVAQQQAVQQQATQQRVPQALSRRQALSRHQALTLRHVPTFFMLEIPWGTRLGLQIAASEKVRLERGLKLSYLTTSRIKAVTWPLELWLHHPISAVLLHSFHNESLERSWQRYYQEHGTKIVAKLAQPQARLTALERRLHYGAHLTRRKEVNPQTSLLDPVPSSAYGISKRRLHQLVCSKAHQRVLCSCLDLDADAVYRTYQHMLQVKSLVLLCLEAAAPSPQLTPAQVSALAPFVFIATVVTSLSQTLHYRCEEAYIKVTADSSCVSDKENAALKTYLQDVPRLIKFLATPSQEQNELHGNAPGVSKGQQRRERARHNAQQRRLYQLLGVSAWRKLKAN